MSIIILKLESQPSILTGNFIGIELDRDYYDIAVNRINEAKEATNG